MLADRTRRLMTQQSLADANVDAFVCALPAHVLLLTGYWPVTGTSVAIATRDGQVAIVAPEDEHQLAIQGWADCVEVFQGGSLEKIEGATDAIFEPLCRVLQGLGLSKGSIGWEAGAAYEPASYAANHLYSAGMGELLRRAVPDAELCSAENMLAKLTAVMTPGEITRMRTACRIAERAFKEGAARLEPGMSETHVAAAFRPALSEYREPHDHVTRADGFTYCMSGPNAAQAYAAYQISRKRRLAEEDLVLVHCNSYVDGYWTDITRTYLLGEPDEGQRKMFDAVLAARAAAIDAIRPGRRAAEVDAAAREVLTARGFGRQFRHATGHGVGFHAIDHNARPRLHPKSDEVLEAGMVFNVEPAIYIDGYAGLRHCDMVLVTSGGAELLTPFQAALSDLEIAMAGR